MARTLVRGNTQIMPESITNVEIAFKDTDNPDGILLEKIQHSDEIVRTNAPVAGDINMDGHKLIGVAPGVDPSDVVIKSQLDSISAGLDPKESVRVATTGNITLNGLQTIDGVALQVGDRVLVKSQTNPVENGIYVADSAGWTRSADADGDINGEVSGGMFTFVEAGSTGAGTGWVVVADGNLNPDTDPITLTQFAGGGALTGGLGIQVAGTEIIADVDNSTIINNGGGGDKLAVKAGGITGTELAIGAVGTVNLADDSVTADKLNGGIAGAGISQNAGSGALDVNVDGSSIIINGDTLEVDTSAIAPGLAGDGLSSTGGDLDVNVDGTSIQIVGGQLQVNTTGITGAMDGAGLVANGAELDVNVDNSTIEIAADVVKVKADGITATEINASAVGAGLSGGSGTAISVDQSVMLAAANYTVRESHNATTDGQTSVTLDNPQVQGTEMVFVNGILMEEGAANDYTITYAAGSAGVITFNFGLQYHATNANKRDKVSVTYFKQA